MMTTVSGLRPGVRPLTQPTRHLRALIDQFDIYRRYIRAGSEIEALLSLSDQQLAERGLTRAAIGRAILEKHGITLGQSSASDRGQADPGV